ncbi:MAG: D-alanine--D-alanine ligase [Balneolaceae bacterium]
MQNPLVLIAFGGVSPEHEVSVLTAMQAFAALENSSYQTVPLYISKTGKWFTGEYLLRLEHYEDLDKIVKKGTPCTFAHNNYGQPVLRELNAGYFRKPKSHPIYAVLVAFHGSHGENGSFQGVCETFNIPYTGSGVMTSGVGMDKVISKSLCKVHGIPVVEGLDFTESEWEAGRDTLLARIEKLEYPVVVKPVHLGSSIGVNFAHDLEALHEAVELAFRYDEQVLVEKAVTPLMEINCSVLGSPGKYKVSVCERPVTRDAHLSFQDKYQSDSGEGKGMASADRVIPADISKELTRKIQNTAKNVFRALRGSGIARLDFLVNSDTEEIYFNEINTIPGSFSFYLWEESGFTFSQLLHTLLDMAINDHRIKNGRVQSYETNLLNEKAVSGIKGLKGKQKEKS